MSHSVPKRLPSDLPVVLFAFGRQLSRPRPAYEQRVRRAFAVAFEPAVEADAVILLGDGRAVEWGFGARHAGSCRIRNRPSPQGAIAPVTLPRTLEAHCGSWPRSKSNQNSMLKGGKEAKKRK